MLCSIFKKEVRVEGVEPPRLAALDPKSSMSTNSITPAFTITSQQKHRTTSYLILSRFWKSDAKIILSFRVCQYFA